MVITFVPNRMIRLNTNCTCNTVRKALVYLTNVTVSSTFVFALAGGVNIGLIRTFVSERGVGRLHFVGDRRGLGRLIFLLFFVPKAPGSILACFINLASVSLSRFLAVSLVTHVPSMLSSALYNRVLKIRGCGVTILICNVATTYDDVNCFVCAEVIGEQGRDGAGAGDDIWA